MFDVPRSRLVFPEGAAQKEREIIVWLISTGAGVRWTAWDGFGSWTVNSYGFSWNECKLHVERGFFCFSSLQSETAKAIFGQFSLKNIEVWWHIFGVVKLKGKRCETELQVASAMWTANDFEVGVFWPLGALDSIYVDLNNTFMAELCQCFNSVCTVCKWGSSLPPKIIPGHELKPHVPDQMT